MSVRARRRKWDDADRGLVVEVVDKLLFADLKTLLYVQSIVGSLVAKKEAENVESQPKPESA